MTPRQFPLDKKTDPVLEADATFTEYVCSEIVLIMI